MTTKLQEGEKHFLRILSATASKDQNVALAAKLEMAQALGDVLRQGVMSGDIVRGLFQVDSSGGEAKYPLDFLAPGTEHLHKAYTIPSVGMIPRKQVEGDFVTVPVYKIGSSIDWSIDYAEDANWFVVSRGLQVMRSSFDKKINDDGWHVIIGAGTDRNILVYDADANAGQFTKRLVSLGKTIFARNGGGNSTSIVKKQLTDMALSLEGQEDIRNWGVDQIDEITRNQIYNAGDDGDKLLRIFGVNLHPLHELGEGQEYQTFFTSTLGGSLQASDVELAVGMDLRPKSNSFVMPIRKDVEMYHDGNLHREGLDSYYGWARLGFSVLDSRDCVLLSY
jgi:hypothetical protein